MRPDDKRQRFDKRWERLAAFHVHAGSLCREIARAERAKKPTMQLRHRLEAIEKRGAEHRGALLLALVRIEWEAEEALERKLREGT